MSKIHISFNNIVICSNKLATAANRIENLIKLHQTHFKKCFLIFAMLCFWELSI